VVFDEIERTDRSPASHGESTTDFLNRVDGRLWARCRALIEDWFERLCPEGRADVRARLRSRDDRDFRAAFWELYCHESLLRLGFSVECHPGVGTGHRRPDFLARQDSTELLLEAKVAADDDDKVASDRREAQVYDTLDRLDSPNHFLHVEVRQAGPGSPSARRLRPKLEKWLAALDPDELGQLMHEDDSWLVSEATPGYVWDEEGWIVTFKPIPKKPETRGSAGVRPVGMYGPGEAYMLDGRGKIRRSVENKASAYGTPGRPFVVAVAAASFSTDDRDVVDALFGSEQVTIVSSGGATSDVIPGRARDGVFLGPAGPQYARVSAVLVAKHLEPWTVAREVPTLWHHPAPDFPAPRAKGGPWRHAVADTSTGEIRFVEPTVSTAEFFGLPDDWPGPEPPFEG
jgi:hypothetical protein